MRNHKSDKRQVDILVLVQFHFFGSCHSLVHHDAGFRAAVAPRDPVEAGGREASAKLRRGLRESLRGRRGEKSMGALIGKLVACGTKADAFFVDELKQGIGCGRDAIVARLNEIAKIPGEIACGSINSNPTSERTSGKPMSMETVYAVLPGPIRSWRRPSSLSPGTLIRGLRM